MRPDQILLDAADLARVTGGAWRNLPDPALGFSAVTKLARAEPGALCVAFDRSGQWAAGEEPPTAAELERAAKAGASAFVVARGQTPAVPYPLLEVARTAEALAAIATANRDRARALRVYVTGSVGKTGFKLMARHALGGLVPLHAVPDSANLDVPILCSLASIHGEDRLAVIEASVANPGRGKRRGRLVRPRVCVFTNISSSHTRYHGSLANLIRAKAESVLGLEPGGVCLMNADHPHFLALKEAVQALRPVPILSWGRERRNDAWLEAAAFEGGLWRVRARVLGRPLRYTLASHHGFAPQASLGVLLLAAYLGLDVAVAAAALAGFEAGETAGRIVSQPLGGGELTLFDYSRRGSIEGFRSGLGDLYRLAAPGSRILLALGESRDLEPADHQEVHEELARLIDLERTARLYTVGEGLRITRAALAGSALLGPHGDTPEAIREALLAELRPGDTLYVQGHHRVWMSRLVEALERRFGPGRPGRPWLPAVPAPNPESQAGAVAPVPAAPLRRLLAGGDVMLSRDLPGWVWEEGADRPFGPLAATLRGADAVLVNLECVLSERGDFACKSGARRPYHYRASHALAEVLIRGGVTALTAANNHAMDFGPEALADQLRLLERCGLPQAGAGLDAEEARRPRLLSCGEVTVAVIGFDTTEPLAAAGEGRAGLFHVGLGEALEVVTPLIREAREAAHLVLLTPHWGENWQEEPTPAIRRLARGLIEAGADAILGHSSHLLQGVEVHRGRAIVYDLGCLLFDRVSERRMRDSALAELRFDRRGVHELRLLPVSLRQCRVRAAKGEARQRIVDTLVARSLELGGEVVPEVPELIEEGVRFPLTPDREPRRPAAGTGRRYRREEVRALPESPELPEPAAAVLAPEGRVVELGGGLRVGGFRHPERVAYRYGFVCEVRFQCRESQRRRWRAELRFIAEDGSGTSYRYPVADGIWHSGRCGGEAWFADRILCRTPAGLPPGRYRLLWNLWTRDPEGRRLYWSETLDGRGGAIVWVELGGLEISREAPRRVAGVEWQRELSFRDPSLRVIG